MISIKDLEENEYYWYVFVPNSAINLQTVRLEKIFLERFADDFPEFRVVRMNDEEHFLTVHITIDPEDNIFQNVFPIEQEDEAKLMWTKEYFKNFKSINGVEFSQFVDLYKKVQNEYPEWII